MPHPRRPPTDFKLLRTIYERYADEYASGVETGAVMIPVDIPGIAGELQVDSNSVFGRLYYHLDPLYGQEKGATGARKAFFAPVVGDDTNCVNFPLLEAVLAGLWQQYRRDLWAVTIAVISALIAVASLAVSIATA